MAQMARGVCAREREREILLISFWMYTPRYKWREILEKITFGNNEKEKLVSEWDNIAEKDYHLAGYTLSV